jgi:hypothetical protein
VNTQRQEVRGTKYDLNKLTAEVAKVSAKEQRECGNNNTRYEVGFTKYDL